MLLSALVLCASLGSADLPVSTRYRADAWSVRDGLPQGSVLGITEDDDGFLWLATFGGLVRFDGRSFLRIDTPEAGFGDHRFIDVVADGEWIVVSTQFDGLYRVHRRRRIAVKLDVTPPVSSAHDLARGPDGAVLAAVDQRLLVIRGTEVSTFAELSADAFEIGIDGRGRVFVGNDTEVRCVSEGCDVPRLTGAHFKQLGLAGGHLVASDIARTWRLEGDAWRPWIDRGFYVLGSDGAGAMWAAGTDGLFRLTKQGPVEQVMLPERRTVGARQAGGLLPRSLVATATGGLWLGTDDRGLFGILDRHAIQIGERNGLGGPSSLATLPLSNGDVVVGGYCSGLFHVELDAGPGRAHRVSALPENACVGGLLEDADGTVLVGSEGGVWRLTGDEGQKVLDLGIDPYGNVSALLPSGDGLLVGADREGLYRVQLGAEPRILKRWRADDGLPDERVTTLVPAPDGSVWVGTQAGLVELVDERLRPALSERTARQTQVRDVLVLDDGTLLGATYGEGLFVAPPAERQAREARWLGRREGLCDEMLSRLLPDPQHRGIIWINSNAGLFWVHDHELLAAAADGRQLVKCRRVDTGEGNGGVLPAGGFLPDGRLVVPTTEGIAIVPPSPIVAGVRPPPGVTLIEHASVDGQQLVVGQANVVPPGRRDLTLELASPAFDAMGPAQFEVALLGDGDVKVDVAGAVRRYLSLAPGDYELQVRRRYADGRRGPLESLHFELAPAIIERTAVRVGAPLSLLLLIGLSLRSWIRALRSRARSLEQELTERQRSERARAERDRLYEAAFRSSPVPLLVFDSDGRLVDRNPAAVPLVGQRGGEPGAWSFVPPADRPQLAACLSHRREVEVGLFAEDGALLRVAMTPAPFTMRDASHTLVALIDVTAARQAEDQRREMLQKTAAAQRLEGLGRLAAGIAHDFNNVLAALSLQMQLLDLEAGDHEGVSESVTEMKAALDRGRSLTERFLVFGGGQTSDAAPQPLDDTVTSREPMLSRLLRPTIDLKLSLSAPHAQITAVPAHIDQVLLNLVVNARDACAEHGTIELSTRPGADGQPSGVEVLAAPEGPTFVLCVRDDGQGMDEATVASACEPFFTTKATGKGTGMGLAVVRGAAQKMGAGLFIDSAPGKGTAVCLVMPCADTSPPRTVEAPPARHWRSLAGLRLLVVDDDHQVLTGVVRALEQAGAEVVSASDGAEALEKAQASHAFDAVVTDYVMPRMTGLDLAEALRDEGMLAPVLMCSGHLDESGALRALPPEVRLLQKPFDVPDLLDALAEICANPPATPNPAS